MSERNHMGGNFQSTCLQYGVVPYAYNYLFDGLFLKGTNMAILTQKYQEASSLSRVLLVTSILMSPQEANCAICYLQNIY